MPHAQCQQHVVGCCVFFFFLKRRDQKQQKAEIMSTDTIISKDGGVIPVSIPYVILSSSPLLIITGFYWFMEVNLVNSVFNGIVRSFIQLSILGAILRPIFLMNNIFLVLGYCSLMITLASFVVSGRVKYNFDNQLYAILISMLSSVSLIGLFGFVIIIRPHPLYNPQYVIPIVGMLLGNCTDGISLALNSLTTALVEQHQEIELYLSFGATSYEAVARLLKIAVELAITPTLNRMAIIGIISIPGMMTGQILGGSKVVDASRYQILIMYLISATVLISIFVILTITLKLGFTSDSSHMLQSSNFVKASEEKLSIFGLIFVGFKTFVGFGGNKQKKAECTLVTEGETDPFCTSIESGLKYIEPKCKLDILSLKKEDSINTSQDFVLSNLTRSIEIGNEGSVIRKRNLFQDLNITITSGEILQVKGPSGCGKSQLLRSIARLSPLEDGAQLILENDDNLWNNATLYRKQVLYVTQHKINIPGSPRQFIHKIASFRSWKSLDGNAPSEDDVLKSTISYISKFGLSSQNLDKEWKVLSGGEAQRIIIAISLASKPKVILFDEATSALDSTTKRAVETSVKEYVKANGAKVLWVSHDEQQSDRMTE